MKVTALKAQARNNARVNVYLDGRFAFSLARIEAARLQVGQELREADVARLKQADEAEAVYERALKFLGSRPRSEAEVRRRLRKHGVDDAAITPTLDRLRRAGLVDDQAFANYWVENRSAFRPKSRRALRLELKQKGLGEDEVQAALAATHDDEAAYRVARQRAARLHQLPALEYRRKLSEFLARRGFDYGTIEAAVARVMREQPPAAVGDKSSD